MTKIFKLRGLDCAHCASKMEKGINKIDGVEKATVNFVTQKLTVDANENKIEEITQNIIKVCKKIEPDCEVIL